MWQQQTPVQLRIVPALEAGDPKKQVQRFLVILWFQLTLTVEMFPEFMHLSRDVSKDIAFYDALPPVLLLVLRSSTRPDHVVPINLRQLCDNMPAASSINRMFTTSMPLRYALQAMAFYATKYKLVSKVAHIAGERNE